MHAQSLSHVRLSVALWTVALQAPLSMRFPTQEYCSDLPFPTQGIFLTQGSKKNHVSCISFIGRQILYHCATGEAPLYQCFCSVTKPCLTLCDHLDCSMPGFSVRTISQSLLKFMSIELVMLSNHLILCCSLLLLPSIFLSIGIFSSELALTSGSQSIGASASASVNI